MNKPFNIEFANAFIPGECDESNNVTLCDINWNLQKINVWVSGETEKTFQIKSITNTPLGLSVKLVDDMRSVEPTVCHAPLDLAIASYSGKFPLPYRAVLQTDIVLLEDMTPVIYTGRIASNNEGSLIIGCASVAPLSDSSHLWTDPQVYVTVSSRQLQDVLSGVLDIGWLFRNSPVYAFDASTHSLDAGRLVPMYHVHELEIVDAACLPGLNFFCTRDETEQKTPDVESNEN